MVKLKALRGKWYLFFALVLGIAFLLFGTFAGGKTADGADTFAQEAEVVRAAEAALEKRLTFLLSEVEGVGEVKVMVTLDASRLRRYLQDENGASGSTHVVVKTETGEAPILVQELYPAVRGVAVICTGGREDAVRQRVTELISALFDLGSHHISIAPAK